GRDGLGDLLVVSRDGLAGGRWHDLQVVLHALDAVDALGDLFRGGLRLIGVDLTAQEDLAAHRLDAHFAPLDPLIGEERDLGLRSEPAVADRALRYLRG